MITSSSLGSIKSTELFNFLQAHFNDGMLIFQKNEQWYCECDESMIKTLGFKSEDQSFPGLFALMSDAEKSGFIGFLNSAINCMLGTVLTQNLVVQSAQGRLLNLKLSGFTTKDPGNQSRTKLVFFVQDLTESVDKENFHHQCNLAAGIGYWNINFEENKPEWSKVTRLIHEVPEDFEPTMEEAVKFYKEGWSREAISKAFNKTIETGIPFELDLLIVTYTKKEKWVRSVGQAEFVDGKLVRVYGTFQDIHSRKIAQLKWEEEHNKFKYAIQGTDLGTWEWDIETGATVFSERWAEILGYKLSELAPINFQTWVDLMDPDDLKVANCKLKSCFEGDADFYDCEFRMKHKDGSKRWIHARGKVVAWTENGAPKLMFGTHEDINDSKTKIQKQAILISQAPLAIAMFDREMRYLAVSSKWLLDYGLGNRSVIGKYHYEIFPEIGDFWKDIHKECLGGATRSSKEDKFLREDGSVQWLRWEVKPWYDEKGAIGGIIMYTEDLTEHKLVAEKLNISLDAFQRNFENAGIGMAIVSQEGKWLNVNDKICEMLGYDKGAFSKLTFQDLTHPDDLELDLRYLEEIIAGKRQTYQIEKRYIHRDGNEVHAILAVSVVKDANDTILYFISQLIDITAVKRAKDQVSKLLKTTQKQNERLKNFAHIVSHNLRSHSSGMNMLLELLEFEHPHLFEMEIMTLMKKGGSNLSETIEHLTDIVNINLNESAEKEIVDLNKVISKTIESVYPIAKKEGVELVCKVPSDTKIIGISAYVESIVLNFVTNGVKYKSPGRDSFLKVDTVVHEEEIEVRFVDNGLGIDLEKNGEALFGMYKTFHKHKDSRGIGLFITKNQIESMGGSVEVESEEGIGTTFRVFLQKE
jgi:PAS domain S-box-containing protein